MLKISRWNKAAKIWWARIFVSGVFIANLSAAIPFILFPDRFTHGFELSGVPGEVSVRSIGILFLMWNATYPPVILRPDRTVMAAGNDVSRLCASVPPFG